MKIIPKFRYWNYILFITRFINVGCKNLRFQMIEFFHKKEDLYISPFSYEKSLQFVRKLNSKKKKQFF